MMDVRNPEYRRLAVESSGLMADWEGDRLLHKFEQAADAIIRAGEMRLRMAELFAQADDPDGDCEFALDAATCFTLAGQESRAAAALARAQAVAAAGRLSPLRGDLPISLRERAQELAALRARLAAFEQELQTANGSPGTREQLTQFRESWRDLAGYAPLQSELGRRALALGDRALALEHFRWAATFDPDSEDYAAGAGRLLIDAGRADEAAALGREFLARHPDATRVRELLAG